MITGKLRTDVDKLWTEFWTGGITNPLTVIEQISFLMFSRLTRRSPTERRHRPRGEEGRAHGHPCQDSLQEKRTAPALVAILQIQRRRDAQNRP
mgnify:CR=1 FL=1